MTRMQGWAAAIAVVAVGLAGCGSSNDGGGAPAPNAGGEVPSVPARPTSVPASAFASVDTFVAYLKSLVEDDTGEPLQIGDAPSPVDDVAPPVPLS